MSFSPIALGNYYPARSIIHGLDPRLKIGALAGLMILTFLAGAPAAVVFHTLAVAGAVAFSGVPVGVFLKGLRLFALLFLFTAVLHLFFTPGTPVLHLDVPVSVTITREGIARGLLISWRLLVVIALSSLLTFTTTPLSITRGLESILNPLKRLRFPVQDFALMMMIAIRFIPVLTEEAQRVWKAQRSRGADPGRGGLKARSRVLMSVVLPVFTGLFRRADEMALALEARGYVPGRERTAMYPLRWKVRDTAALGAVVTWAGALTWFVLAGGTAF